MSESKVETNAGWPGNLTLLFIGLKLTNYIDWSWWWVLSPMWIMFIVYVIAGTIKEFAKP